MLLSEHAWLLFAFGGRSYLGLLTGFSRDHRHANCNEWESETTQDCSLVAYCRLVPLHHRPFQTATTFRSQLRSPYIYLGRHDHSGMTRMSQSSNKMASSKSQYHHYIPRFILRQFAHGKVEIKRLVMAKIPMNSISDSCTRIYLMKSSMCANYHWKSSALDRSENVAVVKTSTTTRTRLIRWGLSISLAS